MIKESHLRAACLCLAFAPSATLWAAPRAESALSGPFVVSATFQPTDVGFAGRPDPQVRLRLEDPSAGGVLASGFQGSAALVGPRDDGSFSARVAIDFLEANTSVEVRVTDVNGAELNSVRLSSPRPGRWSGTLSEVAESQSSLVELFVKEGKALGTAYRISRAHVTTIPVLSRPALRAMGGGTAAISRSLLPEPNAPVSALTTGTANYTGNYSWPGMYFFFVVAGGPPNTCGDIYTYRNGSWVVANDWLCTDSSGFAANGPWYVTYTFPGQDQTDNPTYILWPDNTTTTSTWSVIDVTPPNVDTPLFEYGSCPPGQGGWYCPIGGTVSDGQWGSGFSANWTSMWIQYKDETTGLCWEPPSYGYSCPHSTLGYLNVPVDGTPVLSADWYEPYDPLTACPVNHYCTATIRVQDCWSETTRTVPLRLN